MTTFLHIMSRAGGFLMVREGTVSEAPEEQRLLLMTGMDGVRLNPTEAASLQLAVGRWLLGEAAETIIIEEEERENAGTDQGREGQS